jgi:hypothetical protein
MLLPPEARILVVALRRLGDVLLTTPLIRGVKRAFPAASIEALVFAGTEGILSGNPDLAGIITIAERASIGETLRLLHRLVRRYDLALSTQTGDRPTALAVIAGRQSAGPRDASGFSAAIKRLALSRSYRADRAQHRIVELSRLADLIGIAAAREVVCPQGEVRSDVLPAYPYAVVHAAPKFIYKRWTIDGWRRLAAGLRVRGLATIVIGAAADSAYLDAVWRDAEVERRRADLAGTVGADRRRASLCRPGHRGDAFGRRHRHADRCALRPDRSAHLGTVAARRPRSAVGCRRHHPASRQCLAGAESAALPAVPAGRLRAPARQPQPVPRRIDRRPGLDRGRPGAGDPPRRVSHINR